jgi:hypothetical protein
MNINLAKKELNRFDSIALIFLLLIYSLSIHAQVKVDLKNFSTKNGARVTVSDQLLQVQWPAGSEQNGKIILNLENNKPLFNSIGLVYGGSTREVVKNIDPVFLLTIGKRDLVSQNGWNIFFDKVPLKPHHTDRVNLEKKHAAISSSGSRTTIKIDEVIAENFKGWIEITLFNGSPLFNVAAVLSTSNDSTAIVYDAGLISTEETWNTIAWADVYDKMLAIAGGLADTAKNERVKYRTIIGETKNGSIAVFPPPHQYFYPLDEAFNLQFTWHGKNYRKMVDGYGIGIRQDLYGDNRYVPWFNSPPGTQQRLSFFCLLNKGAADLALNEVKKFTHNDAYVPLQGYKTLSSHFHNEFIMKVVLANRPVPDTPNFVKVFRKLGVDIVHLAEFHYTAHPKGPDAQRLKELHALFQQCRRLSSNKFLLLPGEEPNEFFGGHWLELFPKPVYWIMSRKEGTAFVTEDPDYGKVYRISNAAEMQELLHIENGLAWTAHPRTKGSTDYPDKYKTETFFLSTQFLGAAWKAMPADLSQPRLGKRVLDLIDDMNNWGVNKKVLAEADLFSIEPENEMYAHLNINYLQLNSLPSFDQGWQSVLDVMQKGRFFSTTGEVLIPSFTVNENGVGDTATIDKNGMTTVAFELQWTFPLNFAELISGDGINVYRNKINLNESLPFGTRTFSLPINLSGRKWVRLEVWDVAANGAFTQTIWLR